MFLGGSARVRIMSEGRLFVILIIAQGRAAMVGRRRSSLRSRNVVLAILVAMPWQFVLDAVQASYDAPAITARPALGETSRRLGRSTPGIDENPSAFKSPAVIVDAEEEDGDDSDTPAPLAVRVPTLGLSAATVLPLRASSAARCGSPISHAFQTHLRC